MCSDALDVEPPWPDTLSWLEATDSAGVCIPSLGDASDLAVMLDTSEGVGVWVYRDCMGMWATPWCSTSNRLLVLEVEVEEEEVTPELLMLGMRGLMSPTKLFLMTRGLLLLWLLLLMVVVVVLGPAQMRLLTHNHPRVCIAGPPGHNSCVNAS